METSLKVETIPFKKKLRMYLGDMVYKKKELIPDVGKGFRILAYHSITDELIENDWEENNIPKGLFAKQMQYLADNKYNIISCSQGVEYLIQRKELPPKTVAITFDDGYRNNYTNALPILKKHNFSATLFLTLSFLKDYSGDSRYLSCSELTNIAKSGIIDFGSHGFSHRALARLSKEELDKEIRDAKQRLVDIVNARIDLFAYPFGHSKSYNKTAIEAIKTAGFKGAFTTIFGLNDFRTNPLLIRRNRISWLDQLGEYKKHLHGAYDWCAFCECFRCKRYHI